MTERLLIRFQRDHLRKHDALLRIVSEDYSPEYIVTFKDKCVNQNDRCILYSIDSVITYLERLIRLVMMDSDPTGGRLEIAQISIPNYPDIILKNNRQLLTKMNIVLDVLKCRTV